MAMKPGTKVMLGGLIGLGTTLLADLGLRYWADNEAKPATEGGTPELPFVYDNAPLLAGGVGILVSGLSYFLWKDWAPAIAGMMTSAAAGGAPAIDEYMIRAREKKDAEASQTTAGAGGGMRGLAGGKAAGRLGTGGMRGTAAASRSTSNVSGLFG